MRNGDMSDKCGYLDDIKESHFNVKKELLLISNFEMGDMTFDRLYKEMYRFDIVNNHLQLAKYMLYLKKGIKDSKEMRNICSASNCNAKTNLTLCGKHRRYIASNLSTAAFSEKFGTDQLQSIVFRLMLSDKALISNGKQLFKKISNNYFSNVYAFLVWQMEIINELLSNVAYQSTNKRIFDFLFLMHSYLKNVCKLLILLYSCMDMHLEQLLVIQCFAPTTTVIMTKS